jgi:IPT/TIG domain
MTTRHPDGDGRAQPGQRALGAMESAVQRARASQGLPTPVAAGGPPPPPVAIPPEPPLSPRVPGGSGTRSERWLVAAVAVVGVLVVAAGIALAVSAGRGSGGPSRSAASTPYPAHTRVSPPAATTTPTTTSPTTAVASTPGGPPEISSLSPASGSPGQSTTVAGSNFLSSDGSIVASFNGQVTPTSCPSPEMCTVTVPPPTVGETSAQVTITTASGTSNAVTFSYS